MKKNKVSNRKQVSIQTTDLLNRPIKGKYFPIKNNDPGQYLSLLRASFSHEYYYTLINEVEKLPYSLTYLLSDKTKKKTFELQSKHLAFVDFESELFWAKNIIIRNSSALSNFVVLSKLFSEKLVLGLYTEAEDILNKIEKSFGMSLWLIKNKIAFIQLTEGLEAQKKYSQSLKSELKNGSLIRFVIHWLSIRNENQTSISKFTNQVESAINKLKPKTHFGYIEFCKFHILSNENLTPEEIIQVLRIDYSCSLVDYYESFIHTLNCTVFCDSLSLKSKVLSILLSEKLKINDTRIELLKNIVGISTPLKLIDDPTIISFNMFLSGDYKSSVDLSEEYILKYPDNPFLLYIQAFAKTLLNNSKNEDEEISIENPQSLKTIIVNNLSSIIENGIISSSKKYNDLAKLSLNFSGLRWVSAFSLFVYKENNLFTKTPLTAHNIALKCDQFHPVLIELFDNNFIQLYFDKCLSIFGDNSTLKYYNSLATLEPIILNFENHYSENHINLQNGLINLQSNNFQIAANYSASLIKSPHGYFRRRGFGIITRSYLGLGDLVSACKYVADCLMHDKAFYQFLPLNDITGIIKTGSKEWNLVNGNIDLSIVFDACVKYVDAKFENQRRFAYEDFLIMNGVNKPSDLFSSISKFDKDKIIYYLRHICLESTMDTSDAFENGSQDVIEERLSICRILVEIDVNNEDIYRIEIKDLLRRQVIASRRKEVDQSRIYIDIQSVKEKAVSEVKEDFDRYKTYLIHGLNNVNTNTTKKDLKLDLELNTPDNEANSLLLSMIEDIREIYLSPEIGLDRFISTRIRHGDLERSLRSPIQNHNLITKKESKNGSYLRNSYWLEKLTENSSSLIKSHEKIFLEFSESFDNLISSLKNEFLQIKRNAKPNGFFDFTLYDTSDIGKSIDKDTTLNEFVDLVIRALDSGLIIGLVQIRDMLNVDAKTNAKKILNKLQESAMLFNCSITTELQSEINQARTEIQAQFDKVIDWFVPSSSSNSTPFIIEDAIVVAEAIIKEENPLFNIKIESDDDSSLSIHGHLPIFVDIFTNIFENVVKRSGVESPTAIVQLCSDTSAKNLIIIHINIINNLGENIDQAKLDLDLKRKQSLLKTNSYAQFLATEGNSGFFKIHKSIMDFNLKEHDIKPTMDFYIADNKFQIILSVPFRIFTLE